MNGDEQILVIVVRFTCKCKANCFNVSNTNSYSSVGFACFQKYRFVTCKEKEGAQLEHCKILPCVLSFLGSVFFVHLYNKGKLCSMFLCFLLFITNKYFFNRSVLFLRTEDKEVLKLSTCAYYIQLNYAYYNEQIAVALNNTF